LADQEPRQNFAVNSAIRCNCEMTKLTNSNQSHKS
jgi:hypothetical protein